MRAHRLPRSVVIFPAASLLVVLAGATSCTKSEQASGPTTCCDQPKIPAGVPAFTVVRDEATGPSDGQDVKLHVALKQKTKRDDIYPSLQFLYRYAMTRKTFEPTSFLGAFYATEGEAQFSISDPGSLVYLPGGMGVRRMNLVWLDRQGVSRPVSGAHSVVYAPSVSPDGSSLSFDVGIASKVDVYTFDAQRSIANKISTTGDDYYSIWTPDSKKLVFNSGRLGGQTLFWRNADGTGPEEPLTSSEGGKRATSVSPDGKVLAFSWRTTGSYDVWTLPLDGADHRPVGLLTNSWHELDAKFSPKGNWLAYSSEESGRMEIYIQAYPGAGRRTRVSSDGGRIPVWSRDGQELFFVSGRKLMVVESLAKDSFQPGKPKELFEGGFEDSFDIGINGQEFLMLQPDLAAAETHFNWIQNWTALLDNERAGRKP
jgi:hypothetical protein